MKFFSQIIYSGFKVIESGIFFSEIIWSPYGPLTNLTPMSHMFNFSLIVTYMTGFQLFVAKLMGSMCGARNAHSFHIT